MKRLIFLSIVLSMTMCACTTHDSKKDLYAPDDVSPEYESIYQTEAESIESYQDPEESYINSIDPSDSDSVTPVEAVSDDPDGNPSDEDTTSDSNLMQTPDEMSQTQETIISGQQETNPSVTTHPVYVPSVLETAQETESAPVTDAVPKPSSTEPCVPKAPIEETDQSVTEETESPEITPTQPSVTEETAKPPIAEEPEETSFDIDYWVSYAQDYAQSVGLRLENLAIECWDNPIIAGAHVQNLGKGIQSRLNRYAKDEDISEVWIWAESIGDGQFRIFIGYA